MSSSSHRGAPPPPPPPPVAVSGATSQRRYARSACGLCRQPVWVTSAEAAWREATGARQGAPLPSGNCRRCRLNLSAPSRTCGICLDLVTDPFRYATVRNESWDNSNCGHSFCRGCMRQYAKSMLADGKWSIRCPGEKCHYALLDRDMVRLLLDTFVEPPRREAGGNHQQEEGPGDAAKAEGLALLDRYRAMRSADHGAHLREVLRSLGEADAAEAAAEQAADSFEGWAAAACQACPKCLIIIRKEVGCDHVRCRCGADFCYGCGAPYETRAECICADGRKLAGAPRLAFWLKARGKLDAQ